MPEKPVVYVLPSLDPDERILKLVGMLKQLQGDLELLVIANSPALRGPSARRDARIFCA